MRVLNCACSQKATQFGPADQYLNHIQYANYKLIILLSNCNSSSYTVYGTSSYHHVAAAMQLTLLGLGPTDTDRH